MANYIVAYKLIPGFDMDTAMRDIGGKHKWGVGKLLGNVWYVGTNDSLYIVNQELENILGVSAQLVVVRGQDISFSDSVLTPRTSLSEAWDINKG